MNDYTEVGRLSALPVIIAGLLICFWGYRILKLSLMITGFIAGAFGGWQLALSLANHGAGIELVCALAGGVVGMVLCLWLYFLGIFLIGATAGAVVAAAISNGMGRQVPSLVLLILPIGFGILALVAQKLMIVLSTAFSGAYLIMAGIWPFVMNNPNASRIWLYPAHDRAAGTLGYGALLLWVLLALLGIGSQFRATRKKAKPEPQKQ